MANTSAPRGLVPARHQSGSHYNAAINKYYVPSSDSTAIFIGDPVIVNGSADADGVPGAIRATAAGGNYITGVCVGVYPESRDSLNYRAASTARYIMVMDDPEAEFEIQEDAVGGALAAADIGLNADLVAGTGSTSTGLSAFQLDTSTKATTATLQLKILGIVQRVDNAFATAGDANAKVRVKINLHTMRNTTGV